MRTDLDHLPPAKQRELERVVQILFEEFGDATALATQDWKKKGRILKIILYGSYARCDWVDEQHTAQGSRSDFDLLIIVSDKRLTDPVDYWATAARQEARRVWHACFRTCRSRWSPCTYNNKTVTYHTRDTHTVYRSSIQEIEL